MTQTERFHQIQEQQTAAVAIDQLSDRALEAWFAESGLRVDVVDRCAVAGCELCGPHRLAAAA